MMRALKAIIHDNATPAEALEMFQEYKLK